MGNHILIVFGPELYFIPINRNWNFIRLSELAHTTWRGDVHYIFIVFGITKFHVEETYVWWNVIGALLCRLNQSVSLSTFSNRYSDGFGSWVPWFLGNFGDWDIFAVAERKKSLLLRKLAKFIHLHYNDAIPQGAVQLTFGLLSLTWVNINYVE